jgi:hypothetical protein
MSAFERSLTVLADLGAILEPFEGEGFDVEPIWRAINHTVWRARFAALIDAQPQAFSETFRRQVASAAEVSGADYQAAMFARTALFHRVQGLLARADWLAMPTLTRTAVPVGQDLFLRWRSTASPATTCARPGIHGRWRSTCRDIRRSACPADGARTDCRWGCIWWAASGRMRHCWVSPGCSSRSRPGRIADPTFDRTA